MFLSFLLPKTIGLMFKFDKRYSSYHRFPLVRQASSTSHEGTNLNWVDSLIEYIIKVLPEVMVCRAL